MEAVQDRRADVRREGPRWLRALAGTVRLARPLNVFMFLVGTALGGVLSAGFSAFEGERGVRLLVAAVSAALIGAAANAHNDVYDLDIDRVNRPERPLPSGVVSARAARGLWAAGSAAGIVLGLWLSAAHAVIAVVSVALCFVYSARLKRVPLAGNVVVAFVTPLALLVYGGWAVGPPGPALVGAAFAFLTTLAREIVKDVEDVPGDDGVGARTYPLVAGTTRAAALASAVVVVTIVLTPAPFLLLGYSSLYLVVVLVADGLLLRALWLLQAPAPEVHAGRVSRLLKWAMLVGIAALATAGIAS